MNIVLVLLFEKKNINTIPFYKKEYVNLYLEGRNVYMRKFNPEKELKKIQHGNKNKILYGIIALLVIISIGSSFALYQIRYSKQIIYTKVGPFNKRDVYLAVKVNGEYSDKFPEKTENYAFSGYECDGDATVTFDPDKWIASVNATGPDKCTIKFGPKNINYDTLRRKEGVVVDETNDVNLRYVGATPSNYIWFNCDDYDNLTQEEAATKCEKWRIIGIMNNITIVDEDTKQETTNQSLIKVIRTSKIGDIALNATGSTNWGNSSLQKGLNGPYLNNSDDGTWITELEYTSSSGQNKKADNYKSITSPTLGMIETIKWNTTVEVYSFDITAQQIYKYERGTIAYSTNPITWNGKVALMYSSDYGFATNGSNSGKDRSECLKTNLSQYYNEKCNK